MATDVEKTGFREFAFKQFDGIGFIVDALRAAGGRMAVQTRHLRFDHVRPAFAAAIIHAAADGVPAGDDIVAIDDFAANAERFAAIDDVLLAVLAARRRRDAPTVVGDDYQHRQLVAGPAAPYQTRSEIALGGAGFAAGDDGDAVAAVPLLHQRRARRHDVLHFDHRRDRQDVPIAVGEVADEIAAHRVRVGGGHGHLPDAVDRRHAHSNESGTIAIVEMEIIESGSAAFFDLQSQADVERFLARPADPEIALSRFAHFYHPLFHGSTANHEAVDLQATLSGQRFAPADNIRNEQGHPLTPEGILLIQHPTFPPRRMVALLGYVAPSLPGLYLYFTRLRPHGGRP